MSSLSDPDFCRDIRKALIVGLHSLGEIERLDNAYRIHAELAGESIPDDLCPIHPTGSADTVGTFANALSYLEFLEDRLHAQSA